MIKGDASDTFAFSHFFPERVQLVLDPICDSIYQALVSIKVCAPFSDEAIDASNEQASARAEGGLPSLMDPSGMGGGRSGGRRQEAERRRALALRALDQRLNAAAANRASSAPAAEIVAADTAVIPAPVESQPAEKAAQA